MFPLSAADAACSQVIGPVGSGKSSLLAALNRYMVKESGDVTISGRVAYVAQTAWILNDTVENNILFGLPKNAERYQTALRAAQLVQDLAMLPHGDQTEIGERGVTLSGGQKQRVSIARLIYSDPDVALLDDPLSAVDAHVGRALFDAGIKTAMQRATRVLVTNALQVPPALLNPPSPPCMTPAPAMWRPQSPKPFTLRSTFRPRMWSW